MAENAFQLSDEETNKTMRRADSPPIHHAQRQGQTTTATAASRPAKATPSRFLGLVVLLAVCAWPSTASAAPTMPSTAHQLQIGVPWSSSLPAQGVSGGREWLRLPEPMGPGDKITFASDADSRTRYCLIPAVDDFGAADAADSCGSNNYVGTVPHVDLYAGKYRRTLKWTAPESHGFLHVVGDGDCCSKVTTVYSVMVERIDHYTPDFTPPALYILDRQAKLNRKRRAANIRLVCPADEASPPCSGSVLVTTRGKVRVGKTRRILTLGRATFSLGANETGTITLRLNPRRVKVALRGRKSIRTHLTVRARDKANNRSAQQFNLRLVRR